MASTNTPSLCRLCHAPLRDPAPRRQLCSVCDDYAQHVALEANRRFDRVLDDLQNGTMFLAASRNAH
jgi:hypothetical protein